MTCTAEAGSPKISAICPRTMYGICVPVVMTIRDRSTLAMQQCVSSGTCWTDGLVKTSSKMWSLCANPDSISPRRTLNVLHVFGSPERLINMSAKVAPSSP